MKVRRRAAATDVRTPGDTSVEAAEQASLWRLITEALDLVPIGLVISGRDGETVLANVRSRSLFGDLTADTLANATLKRSIDRATAGVTAFETVDIAGAQPRQAEVTATPLTGGGAVATVVDTTERLRLDAVRRDFVANVNHELRTPIGALAVLAETLEVERAPATVERLAGRIQAEAARAGALIDELLDFARVEAVDQPPHRPVSVAEVVDVAVARVAAAAGRRRIRVEAAVDPDVIVVGDIDQLVAAVANLIDNAIKYSDAGTTVDVAARVAGKGETVDVVVRDEGIGIPPRDLDRVFERFYRVDQARDRRTGGTGLGLAIVRHVAVNHGGEVLVESQEGVGTAFTLRLPTGGPR